MRVIWDPVVRSWLVVAVRSPVILCGVEVVDEDYECCCLQQLSAKHESFRQMMPAGFAALCVIWSTSRAMQAA